MAAKASEDPAGAAGADRAAREPTRSAPCPRPAGRRRAGPGDADLARRRHQHQGEAAGELRPRADGAVLARRRLLHRRRRLRGGARVHRLEPESSGATRRIRRRRSRSSTTPNQHETSGQDVQLSDLQRRRPHDSRARGVGRHAGRPRSDRRARRRIRRPRAAWRRSCTRSSSARPPRPIRRFIDQLATVYLQNGTAHQAGAAASVRRRRSFRIRRSSSPATPGRRSSSSAR